MDEPKEIQLPAVIQSFFLTPEEHELFVQASGITNMNPLCEQLKDTAFRNIFENSFGVEAAKMCSEYDTTIRISTRVRPQRVIRSDSHLRTLRILPPTQKDIDRAHELAAEYGWE